jgi:hypothetical protein
MFARIIEIIKNWFRDPRNTYTPDPYDPMEY